MGVYSIVTINTSFLNLRGATKQTFWVGTEAKTEITGV
jgi:hypothetical protein